MKIRIFLIISILSLGFCACAQDTKRTAVTPPKHDSFVNETKVMVIQKAIMEKVPKQIGPVSDYANVLTKEQVAILDSLMRGIWAKTSNEIFVSILDSGMTNRNDFQEFCEYMFFSSGYMKPAKGALIAVDPSIRKVLIHAGDELDKSISDELFQSVINEMTPELHTGKYFEGLKTGILSLSAKMAKAG